MILGAKPKDALLSAALSAGLGAMFPGQQAQTEQLSGAKTNLSAFGGATGDKATEQIIKDKLKQPPGGAGFGAFKGVELKTVGEVFEKLDVFLKAVDAKAKAEETANTDSPAEVKTEEK